MTYKVLVVDDQESIRSFVTEMLEYDGYEAYSAIDGSEGIAQLSLHKPDLVITDMRMPGMDGFQFARHVRNSCDAPIIMLTGMGETPQEADGLELIDAFHPKPLDMSEFLSIMESLLEGRIANSAISQMQAVS